MTVKELVKEHLEKNGYDGLCRDDCGCGLDDFMPCSSFALEGVPTCCTPAYKHLVKNGELNDIVYSTEKPEAQE